MNRKFQLKNMIENELNDEQHLWLLNFIGNEMGLRKKIVEREKYCLIDIANFTEEELDMIGNFVREKLLKKT